MDALLPGRPGRYRRRQRNPRPRRRPRDGSRQGHRPERGDRQSRVPALGGHQGIARAWRTRATRRSERVGLRSAACRGWSGHREDPDRHQRGAASKDTRTASQTAARCPGRGSAGTIGATTPRTPGAGPTPAPPRGTAGGRPGHSRAVGPAGEVAAEQVHATNASVPPDDKEGDSIRAGAPGPTPQMLILTDSIFGPHLNRRSPLKSLISIRRSEKRGVTRESEGTRALLGWEFLVW